MATHGAPPYYVNKWVTFAACALLQFSAGLPYAFGMYSPELKQTFRWSQAELTGFGTALNIGAFAAVIPGVLLDFLKHHDSGPRCAPDLHARAAQICIFVQVPRAGIPTARHWQLQESYSPATVISWICISN